MNDIDNKKYNISKKKYNIMTVFKNYLIPEDVINMKIYKYLKMSDMIIFGLLNKELKNDNDLIINKVKKIQKSFRYNRLPCNYGDMYLFGKSLSWENYYKYMKVYKKKLLYRMLIINMNDGLFKKYPYFLMNKSMDDTSSRYLIVNDWLKRNFPDDINRITKRDVLNFLKENRITVREIMYAGW